MRGRTRRRKVGRCYGHRRCFCTHTRASKDSRIMGGRTAFLEDRIEHFDIPLVRVRVRVWVEVGVGVSVWVGVSGVLPAGTSPIGFGKNPS